VQHIDSPERLPFPSANRSEDTDEQSARTAVAMELSFVTSSLSFVALKLIPYSVVRAVGRHGNKSQAIHLVTGIQHKSVLKSCLLSSGGVRVGFGKTNVTH
jgi:hypothetical protein